MLACIDVLIILKLLAKTQNLSKVFNCKKKIYYSSSYFLLLTPFSSSLLIPHFCYWRRPILKKKNKPEKCPNYNSTVGTFDKSNIPNRRTSFTVKQSQKIMGKGLQKVISSVLCPRRTLDVSLLFQEHLCLIHFLESLRI